VSDEHEALNRAVSRLEALTAALRDAGADPDTLERLATEAQEASAQVSELLPRVIREIEETAARGPVVPEETGDEADPSSPGSAPDHQVPGV